MEHAFVAAIRAYYSINLTKDIVPGNMYQVINDQEYSLNEQFHLNLILIIKKHMPWKMLISQKAFPV